MARDGFSHAWPCGRIGSRPPRDSADAGSGDGKDNGLEVFALSLKKSDGTHWQDRFRDAVWRQCPKRKLCAASGASPSEDNPFPFFVDLSGLGIADAARKIASLRLHVLIDLNGYTTDERSELLAFRPAPVITQAIGYPGTMGAPFVPYALLDRYASPLSLPSGVGSARRAMSESLVLMPNCYQANDHSRRRKDLSFEYGFASAGRGALDDSASIVDNAGVTGRARGRRRQRLHLVNFNQLYKASPAASDLWCSVMRRTHHADLWLLSQPPEGEPALRAEFAACGIDHRRRVAFAPLVSDISEHLRRTARADMLVDTLEYSSHTTGSDALWGGVPLLTLPGEAMAARVGWSLIRAAGVPDGRVQGLREYMDRAAEFGSSSI